MYKKLTTLIAAGCLAATLSPAAMAGTLDDIIAKGKIVVGVKADYAPWGMRDASGGVVGMEIDMVRDLAKRIGDKAGKTIDVELVVTVSSNRMQFLQQGKIDLMIATMSDKPDRRKVVGIVQPNYYSSGVAIFAYKDSGIDGWDSIKGKKICGIQGAWYNKEHGIKRGAEMVAFKGVPEVEAALLDGRCGGWLYDDSAFVPRKVNNPDKWRDYSISTPVVDDVPWGAAVRREDLHKPIGQMLSEAIIDWHKDGTIIALEKKWGIPKTQWPEDMRKNCLAGDKICDTKHDPGE